MPLGLIFTKKTVTVFEVLNFKESIGVGRNIEEEHSLVLKCKLFISLVKCTVYVSRAAAGWKPVFILWNSLKVLTKLRPRTMYLYVAQLIRM